MAGTHPCPYTLKQPDQALQQERSPSLPTPKRGHRSQTSQSLCPGSKRPSQSQASLRSPPLGSGDTSGFLEGAECRRVRLEKGFAGEDPARTQAARTRKGAQSVERSHRSCHRQEGKSSVLPPPLPVRATYRARLFIFLDSYKN